MSQSVKGQTYIPDVPSELLLRLLEEGKFQASLPKRSLMQMADYIIIAVPTPITNEQPDLSAVIAASQSVKEQLRKGQTIILESSTYPGTLEEVILPILNQSGLKAGKDFYLGYSPERIDPGNPDYPLQKIPKVISGHTDSCLTRVEALYKTVFDQVVPVSSPREAEMCKLFENIQRLVNISLVNEINNLCQHLDINFRECLRAASTKPFGFTPYWPGPGIGGHCIPVDPVYFQWKAKQRGLTSQLIDQALKINKEMPKYVVDRINQELDQSENQQKKVLLVGLTYKKDVNDMRESPALDIFQHLHEQGYQVHYIDPYVPTIEIEQNKYKSCSLSKELLQDMDITVVLTDHSIIDWKMVKQYASKVIDTRGVFDKIN